MEDTTTRDAVNLFYKLKQDYERNLTRMKQKIINNSALNKKQKRERFLLLKPKCINCKRPVGTIFSVKDRKLIAMCGAHSLKGGVKPCSLDINIEKGAVVSLDSLLKTLEDLKEKEKDEIITNKLNLLFNFISEETAISLFDKQKSEFTDTQQTYENFLKQYVSITQLTEKREQINLTDLQIYETLKNIKDNLTKSIKETDLTQKQLISDSIEIYVDKLIPLLQINNKLKYQTRSMVFDEEDNTYNLAEQSYTAAQVEIALEPIQVIKNNK